MVRFLSLGAAVLPLVIGSSLHDDKNRPVSKVITLLKDMLKQLEKEAQDDEDIYDKMACWCQTNDREKTKSIKEAEVRIEQLTTEVEELTADSARLNTEVKNHEKEVAEQQTALDKATSIREKQLAEFNAEEKDLLESISALKAAVTVLQKHHGGGGESFLQLPRTHLLGVAATLQHEISRHSSILEGVLTPSEKRLAASFIQSPQDYFDSSPTYKQAYAPQSGEIFGILRQMLETFEANLAESQKEEAEDQKAYNGLKQAKEEEIAAGQSQIDTKTQNLADTDQKNEQTKVDIVDTKGSLSADEQFLMMLKEKCQMTDKEWEERQKTRQMEMEAVSKALAVLSADDAHDLFTKTFNPALVQSGAGVESERRQKASELLSRVANQLRSPRLATLAYQVKLDAFTRVKKAIDDMVAQLLKERADEIKHRDFCTSELNENELQTEKKEREKNDLLTKIDNLETHIKELTEALDQLKAEIKEIQVQLKRAGEDREKQNKEFQMTVADQRETQRLLKAALTFLRGFYGKGRAQGQATLVQQEPVGPPPPAGFEAYEKNEQHGGVMKMIEEIMGDAKSMENEAIRSEEDAQKAYEDFVKESNNSIEAKSRDITNKSEAKANAETEHVETVKEKDSVVLDLDQLSNYNAQLHTSCDFVLKNFDVRQTARDEEVEALRQAKSILSGAKFEDFLQSA